MEQRESITDDDIPVLAGLGYAVGRAQLLELAMVKVIEVERQDLSVDFEKRWPEIAKWLRLSAGQSARKLRLHSEVVDDLKALAHRRNFVAHQAWLTYRTERGVQLGPTVFAEWLDNEARVFGQAYNGLMNLLGLLRSDPGLPADRCLTVWREAVSTPVSAINLPAGLGSNGGPAAGTSR